MWNRWPLALGFALLAFCLLGAQVLSQGQPTAPAARATGTGGAVASVDHRATAIGLEILRQGGNAVDAAIATAAALGVLEPFSCGIGGGDFMMIYLKDGDRVMTLDGREQAPASADVDMFRNPNSPDGEPLPFYPNRITSGLAVGVPGTPMTWVEALNRYGTLTLAEALQPAIALAEEGVEVDAVFARQIEQNQARFAALTSTAALYLPQGRPPQVGERFANPDLAHTYRLLADQGINAFYRGDIGRAIAQTVQHPPAVASPPFPVLPGGMSLTDLDEYHLQVSPPVTASYRGHQVYGMGLPSSGGITSLQVLNLLAGFDLAQMDRAEAWHRVIEAERLAFADRGTYLGDPEYVDVPTAGLLSLTYAEERRSLIRSTATPGGADFRATAGNPFRYQTDPSPSGTGWMTAIAPSAEGQSTTHLTTADAAGNLVSYTLTLESEGGSGIVVPGYGFILNNELTDFDAIAPHANSPEPGKRPRSSMAPTLIHQMNGDWLAIGSPGGSTIITTVLGIAVNVLDFGLSLDEAIAFPRISQRNSGSTWVDQGGDQTDLGQALMQLGHDVNPVAELGAATGVLVRLDGTQLAVAEPLRRGGGSAGVVTPD